MPRILCLICSISSVLINCLGYSVEIYGEEVDKLTLDERITISSMATEMGAIIVLFPPNDVVIKFAEERSGRKDRESTGRS